jgi:hypothetical protein
MQPITNILLQNKMEQYNKALLLTCWMEVVKDRHKSGNQMVILVWHPHGNQLHKFHSDLQWYCVCNPAQTNTMCVTPVQSCSKVQHITRSTTTPCHLKVKLQSIPKTSCILNNKRQRPANISVLSRYFIRLSGDLETVL